MRRILLRLVVVAVMAAMLALTAVPAFAQATVVPKFCTDTSTGEVCRHFTSTPSGNRNNHITTEIETPTVDVRTKQIQHIHPTT